MITGVSNVPCTDGSIIKLKTTYTFKPHQCQCTALNFYEKYKDNKLIGSETETLEICWYTNESMEKLLNSQGLQLINVIQTDFNPLGDVIYEALNPL